MIDTETTNDVDELYRSHQARLVSYAARWTRNRHDAEDAVHEAFTVALAELHTVRPQSPIGWLFGITRRRAQAAARGYGREIPTEAVEWTPDTTTEQAPSTDGRCMADPDTAAYVLAALDALPPRQREALRLWAVEGLTWPQVAERMGIAQASARRTAYASLHTLRTT